MLRISRLAAALFVLVGGLVHLQLWRSGYRGIPYIGVSFVANIAVSAILAAVVVIRGNIRVALAGIAFSAASLVALVMSRTVGLFGFTERAWTVQAVRATTAEFGAMVAFAIVLIAISGRLPTPSLIPLPLRRGRSA